jgi:tRNA(Ile)-lysidine synthase
MKVPMVARRLRDLLEPALAALPPGPVAVSLSGGLDSSVLLHGLSCLPSARERGLRAIHVDHGLQDESRQWAERCARMAEACDVPLTSLDAHVERDSGFGLEASARRARHGAIQQAMVPGEIVAFAHHRDDQAETVLLKLLRGAGPEGMAAMRKLRPFGSGHAWRPLLALPRGALRAYAEHHQLGWIQDPSNMNTRIDRNYLRLDVMPRLRKRWPEADASITQSANWARVASEFIEAQTLRALARVQGIDPMTIYYREWMALPEALRDPVLRRWLRDIALPEPSQHQVGELVRQLAEANEDKLPCVRWPGVEVRRYRDLLYARRPLHMTPSGWETEWQGELLDLPAGLGTLELMDEAGNASPLSLEQPLRVRFRRGGETLRLAAQSFHRDLRDLFQEAGVPPWERGRLPLVIDHQGQLLAVGDLFQSDAGRSLFQKVSRRLVWTPTIDHRKPAS